MAENNHPNNNSNWPKSPNSMKSVGMSDKAPPAKKKPKSKKESDLPRPLPEGVLASNESLYDTIVYVIFCAEHQNIACLNMAKCRCVWLPFVPIGTQEVTWERAVQDGVSILIGRNDPEMEAEEAERMQPKYNLSYLRLQRIQLPSKKVVLRLTVLVQLQKNPQFECCRNTERVNWLSLANVEQGRVDKLWGPELKTFTELMATPQTQIVHEYTAENTLHYLHLTGSWQYELLRTFKLTEQHVYQIWTDFLEHCHPSYGMALESFRVYFLKYGRVLSGMQLVRLFNAFCQSGEKRPWIDFHEFLITLVAMEPNCPSKLEARFRLIFRYYDFEQKGALNGPNICALLNDAMPLWTPEKIEQSARTYLNNREQLSYEEFVSAAIPSTILQPLCRSPRSMLKQINWSLSRKLKERVLASKTCEGVLKAKRITKGTCWACRTQQYEYGNHAVTLDTVSRCVEPTLIPVTTGRTNNQQNSASNQPPQAKITRSQYSLEYVFALQSVPNIFLDLVREFHVNIVNKKNTQPTGVMTQQQEWNIFHKYFRIMANELCAALDNESKLVKANAPAIVVGDVQGDLHTLLQLEALLWQSFPVVPENLVFLGNYSGEHYNYGVECLIYLFAIKLCSPNKVFLLRGARELNTSSSEAGTLLTQSCAKYGLENGKVIHNIVAQVFAKLPIAVLLDDLVLCTNSGIPSCASGVRLAPLLKAPKEMILPQRDCPMAYEIITRFPKDISIEDTATAVIEGNNSNNNKNSAANVQTQEPPISTQHAFKTVKCKMDSSKKSHNKSSFVTKASVRKSIKSIKSVKKASLPWSAKKSLPLTSKSTKSLKLIKSTTAAPKSVDSARTTKSIKSLKSIESHNETSNSSLYPPTLPLSPLDGKFKNVLSKDNTPTTNTTTISDNSNPYQFEIGCTMQLMHNLKPTFLTKCGKVSRKVTKHVQKKPATCPTKGKRPPKETNNKTRTDSTTITFDENEFEEFMTTNNLAYLIRSGAAYRWPGQGFKISYERCVSIFSCSHYEKRNNVASVALVDGHCVRVVRHAISCAMNTNTTAIPIN